MEGGLGRSVLCLARDESQVMLELAGRWTRAGDWTERWERPRYGKILGHDKCIHFST